MSPQTRRRLLVTGGAGFIGSNFVHHRLERDPEERVVVLDVLTYAGNLANLEPVRQSPGFRFVRGDIRDRRLIAELLREERIDTVVHFAAESHVDRSIAGPELFTEVNVGGTQILLEAARAAWADGASELDRPPRFHHISTDEVYGSLGPEDPAFSETTPYAPRSPYAASKAAADHLVSAYHHTYGLPVTISNCSNNYGPYQFPEKLIPLLVVNLLAGEHLPIYGDGLNVRDWLYVEDHCRGIDLALELGRAGETYNIGGTCERTNLEVVETLCDLMDELFTERAELARSFPDCPAASGAPCRDSIRMVRDRPGHDRRYAIDCRRAQRELGFEVGVSFEEGLRRTVEWYLENADWWRSVMDASYRQWISEQYAPAES